MLSNRSVEMLNKLLDYYAVRHKVIANNIANAEVNGFQPSDVKFTRELADAIANGDAEGMRHARWETHTPTTELTGVAGGVDVEREIGAILRNKALFDTFTEAIAFKFRMLRTAMTK